MSLLTEWQADMSADLLTGRSCTVGLLQLNDALADKPSEALDYSLKQEQTRLMVVGQRIAKCMAK